MNKGEGTNIQPVGQNKNDCADVSKDLEIGKLSWINQGRPHVFMGFLTRGRQESQKQRRRMKTESGVGVMCCEHGVRGHKLRSMGSL